MGDPHPPPATAGPDAAAPTRARPPWRRELLLLAVLAAFFAVCELRQPYYFLQDDNRTSQLPLFVQYVRAVGGGELPLYNFHQFLGTPSFSIGSVAFLYPPVYAAVAASEVLFGHPFAAVDLLVALHFAVGLIGMHRLLRWLDVGGAPAAFGALSWPLASVAMYTATSWWNVAGVIAYLPWMVLLALRLVRGGRIGTLVALAAVRTLFLYVGQVQLFVYGVCLEALCALCAAWSEAVPRRRFVRAAGPYLLSLFFTAAAALPFVEPLWHHVGLSRERAGAQRLNAFVDGSYNLVAWLEGAVNPYHPRTGEYEERYPFLSFTGHSTVLLLLAAPLLLRRKSPAVLPARVFAVPLAVAFLWTMGALDRVLYHVPVFNRFRWHFRVNVFLVFFMLVIAAMAFAAADRLLRGRLGSRGVRLAVAAALAVQLAGFAWLYATLPARSYNTTPHRQQPPLSEPLAARLAGGRIVSLGFLVDDPYGAQQLAFDYATLWGFFHRAGYGNLLSAEHARYVTGTVDGDDRRLQFDGVYKRPEVPVAAFEPWAVSWYVLAKDRSEPAQTERYRAQLAGRGLRLVSEDAERLVFHDRRAEPLVALYEGDRRVALAPHVGGRSLAVRFAPGARPRTLVASFLAVAGLGAVDGNGRPLPLAADARGRIVVAVPAGVESVRIVYAEPALVRGAWHAALLVALGVLLVPLLGRWAHAVTGPPAGPGPPPRSG